MLDALVDWLAQCWHDLDTWAQRASNPTAAACAVFVERIARGLHQLREVLAERACVATDDEAAQ